MPIKIKIGDVATQAEEKKPVQAQIPLKITKSLEGNLLIADHKCGTHCCFLLDRLRVQGRWGWCFDNLAQ